ncbi:peptidoglycan-binding protein [Streptomyces albus]|uniref:peptidoglycan-binding domain-containing protein n=1 Tax=Streptomyces albus TaxID=1888 RepID=UPI00131BF758|nr:peptidoglycan-binding domain-containing protein [Streptomyces albus]
MPVGQHKHAARLPRRWRGRLLSAAGVAALALLAFALVRMLGAPIDPPKSPTIQAKPSPVPSATATVTAQPSPAPVVTTTVAPTAPPPRIGPSSAPPSPSSPPEAGGSSGTPGTGDSARTMRRGDEGAEVLSLQQRLREVGIQTAPLNGTYDQPTEAAVQNYQAMRRIEADPAGVYGPATRSALEAET